MLLLLPLLGSGTARSQSGGLGAGPSTTSEPPPVADWIGEGEREDFDWHVDISRPELRMDQRFELSLKVQIETEDLSEGVGDHELLFLTVVTDRDGTWTEASPTERQSIDSDPDERTTVEFESYVSLIPGRYTVWVIVEDETTGQRNLKRKNTEADRIGNDPLPEAYADFPRVAFAHVEQVGTMRVRQFDGDLSMPVASSRPLDVELIATLSAPEQWPGGGAISRHTENILGALTALSELDLENGSLSATGVDLTRREVVFEHDSVPLDRIALAEAFERVNRSSISVDALRDRSDNAAFLRRYIQSDITPRDRPPVLDSGESRPALRILILLAGVMRFEDHPDLSEVRLEGPCDCRVYHVRFKQEPADLFDQLDDLLDPFDPPTFDIITPRDFRKVIGEIIEDLERF